VGIEKMLFRCTRLPLISKRDKPTMRTNKFAEISDLPRRFVATV